MIKFFRHIRQRLLTENPPAGRAGRYLIYAIGEIILVVIGILIALQLNEWNRKIQDQKLSTLYYQELLQDVESDINNLTNMTLRCKKTKSSIDSLITSLQNQTYKIANQEILQFAINQYYRVPGWQFNLNTYKELESSGNLKYIENDEIRSAITSYANSIENARVVRERYTEDIISKVFYIDKYVFTLLKDNGELISIIDFEGLANDKHIINYFSRISMRWLNNRWAFENLNKKAKKIQESILLELE